MRRFRSEIGEVDKSQVIRNTTHEIRKEHFYVLECERNRSSKGQSSEVDRTYWFSFAYTSGWVFRASLVDEDEYAS